MGHRADIHRVLITGAAGFLGSHLCDRFIDAGWCVVGVDNLLTGTEENLAHLSGHPRFTLTKHDVTTPFFLDDPVQLVLHFASPASPKDYLRYPIHTLKVDALGTLHTLGLARAHGARYVLASTSEVYGDPQVHPQPESYWGHVNPIGPRSVYDEAKRFAEALALAYHRSHAIDVRIARIFNTYGPRMRLDDGRVIPTFVVKALLGEPLPVQGDGRQTRSFCYVDDLMEGIYRLATLDGLAGEVVNLGNPDEYTVGDLAEIVRRLTGRDVPIAHMPLPTDDPKRRCPEISKARARLEWSPLVSLPDGLVQTIDWFVHSLVVGESEALGVSGVGG
ncbi:MAG TPA: UDP-glucuronic acid decarboxylase family protein [bacterium]|nr:UDP-glucuronic acid decarboxylase family protein [bacterium]